jgi:hypothetical protein
MLQVGESPTIESKQKDVQEGTGSERNRRRGGVRNLTARIKFTGLSANVV